MAYFFINTSQQTNIVYMAKGKLARIDSKNKPGNFLELCEKEVVRTKFDSRLNRLSYYSLNLENKKEKGVVNNIIFKSSRVLESLVIFNGLARTYDKYIYSDSRLRKSMDYDRKCVGKAWWNFCTGLTKPRNPPIIHFIVIKETSGEEKK